MINHDLARERNLDPETIQKQLDKIRKIPIRYICFDSAHHAQQRARELYQLLVGTGGRTEIITLSAKDPGSASYDELSELRSYALGD